MTEYQWMNNEEVWPAQTATTRIWHDLDLETICESSELVGVNIRVKPVFVPGWFKDKDTTGVARWLTAEPARSVWVRITDLTEAP
jgi:hypothetical protein